MTVTMMAVTTLFAAETIGVVIALQGRATAAQPQAQARALALKSDVFLNDNITTEAGGRLQILFDDDSVISQGENSTLVIDEYVYSPRKEDDNRFGARMLKGVFRVITGEITKLNPDRFKVRGRLATIGIRGCDVGCRVGQTLEHVYILELHRRENVIVGPLDDQGAQPDAWQFDPITVKRGGRVVSIEANKQTMERDFQAGELALFVGAVMPTPGGAPRPAKPAGGGPQGGEGEPDGEEPGDGEGDGEGGGDQGGRKPRRHGARRRGAGGGYVHNGMTGDVRDPITDPPGLVQPEGDTEPSTVPPKTKPKFVVRERGTDWLWGVWIKDKKIVDVESRTASPVDVATLIEYTSGVGVHHLQGDGTTAALIKGFGKQTYLEGECRINVWAGQTGGPTWDGAFLMGGGGANNAIGGASAPGDRLAFTAYGSINANGRMVGQHDMYGLRFNGKQYGPDSIVGEYIYGQLVGEKDTARPKVTGSVGKYGFDHGDVKLKGVWGNDFPPPRSGGSDMLP